MVKEPPSWSPDAVSGTVLMEYLQRVSPQFVAAEFVLIPVRRTNVRRERLAILTVGVAVEPYWFIEEQLR